ncbi:MAG TPA: hypothetical protein VER55_10445 [Ardenticatenaceae bacterium]|nr:hypothetical protein [Ardenticatenaceae bacterium]
MDTVHIPASRLVMPTAAESTSVVKDGAKWGAATGFSLTIAYGFLLLWLLVVGGSLPILRGESYPGESAGDVVGSLVIVFVIGSIVVFSVGAFHGTLIGLLTGAAVGFLLALFPRPCWKRVGVLLGFAVALSIVWFVHVVWLLVLFRDYATFFGYIIWFGLPSLIYVAASIVMSWRLSR